MRAQQGERMALGSLVHRYEKPLYNYLYRMLGQAEEAEDCFQDSFIKVQKNLPSYKADMPFKPWLYRIAGNTARDQIRKRKHRQHATLTEQEASATTADSAAREHELQERLEQALARLSEKHREVFLMARYQSMDYESISQALDIPVGTVKSRMRKATQQLKQSLGLT